MIKPLSENKKLVFAITNCIPVGKVASYGMINQILNITHHKNLTPLVVGNILSGMRSDEYDLCPWQRVVGVNGTIPALKLGLRGSLQIQLLEIEGVNLIDNKVDMSSYCIELAHLLKLYQKTDIV